jgi:hypothetical protein
MIPEYRCDRVVSSFHEVITVPGEIRESDRFEFNRSEVAVKMIDGEAVAIDVLTGTYHGMTGTACRILRLMELGLSLGQIADTVEARHPEARGQVRGDLLKFASQLLEHRIVRQTTGPDQASDTTPAFDDATYAAPELETYDDMAELLAIDLPIPIVLDTACDGDQWTRQDSEVSGLTRGV